jgi:hypothetical protein
MPLITPVAAPAEATNELLLLHVPPDIASFKVEGTPVQSMVGPVIAEGWGFTVTETTDAQPAGKV